MVIQEENVKGVHTVHSKNIHKREKLKLKYTRRNVVGKIRGEWNEKYSIEVL